MIERGDRNRGSLEKRTLYVLYETPSDKWREIDAYQEVHGERQYSVQGYETDLVAFPTEAQLKRDADPSLPRADYAVRIELLTMVSPDSMSAPAFLYSSPYRLRVTRTNVEPNFSIILPFVERSQGRFLFEKLEQEITNPRKEREQAAREQLRTDFEVGLTSFENFLRS